MYALPWPSQHLLSLADWDALPYDPEHRYELVKGVLEVTGLPSLNHQRLVAQLVKQLYAPLDAAELTYFGEFDVRLEGVWPPTVRRPDLSVVPTKIADLEPSRLNSTELAMAIEVVSPTSIDRDHITKFCEYAEAGIPVYWVIDLEPRTTITVYQLVGREYSRVTTSDSIIHVAEPVPLTVDVSALLPHRR